MPSSLDNLPSWVVIAASVAAAGVLFWILVKTLKWFLWIVLIVAAAACAVAAARLLLN